MKMAGRRWPLRPAFTLIELVTVIVILGILGAAIAAPTMSYIDSIRARAAAGRLVADIRFAQRTALQSGLATWVVFDTSNNRYQLYVEDPANLGKAGRLPMQNPLDRTTNPVEFGAGAFTGVGLSAVDINSTSEIEFDSFGIPYDANRLATTSDGSVTLSSGVSITIEPVSGFVEQTG